MADRYWVGGTAIWDGTVGTKWSTTSGGSGGASIPTSADSVFFDQAGPYTVQLGASTYQTLNCLDFTISGANVTLTSVAGPPNIFIYGSFSIASTTVWNATQIIGNFVATTTGKTINSNGVTVNFNNIIFNGVGGGWTLSGAFTVGTTRTITLTAGALDIAGFTLSTGLFSSNNSNTRSIAFGSGFIALTSTVAGTTVLQMSTLTNFSSTGTGGFSSATNVTKTFSSGVTAGGSVTTGPSMFVTAGSGVITLNGASYWNTLSFVGSTSTVNATAAQTLVYATNLILGSGASYFINATPTFNMTVKGNTKGMSGTLTVSSAITFTWDTSGGSCFVTTIVLSAGKITSTGAGTVSVSQAVTQSGGEMAINGCTWNISSSGSGNYTYTGGTITDTGGATLTISTIAGSGNFVLNGPTLSLPISATTTFRVARTFVLTSGTLSLSANSSIFNTTATTLGAIQHNGGNITLNNFELTVGIFESNNSTVRSLSFGTGNIIISYTGAVTLLQMSTLTNITLTGTGGFVIPVTATSTVVVCGTTGGTTTNAPNLRFSSGSLGPTITTGSWFNKLDFGTSSFTVAATSLNLNSLILGSGTYTSLTANMRGAGTINTNTKPCILVINNDVNTTTLVAAANAATFTMTAGTIDFATFNLTVTSTVTFAGGSLSNIGTITCTTWSVISGTFTLTSGTITPSSGFTVSGTGTFNYNGGTLSAFATFTHTAGTVSFGKAYALTATGSYTLTAGTLTLNGFNLTTGTFSSNGSGTRSINFGTNNILLTTTTSAQTVLQMTQVTNFTYTATTGGFVTNGAVARTLIFGTFATGVSAAIAPNLTINSGASAITINATSWFNTINFTGYTGTVTGSVIIGTDMILSSGGTFTALTVQLLTTQSMPAVSAYNGKTISILISAGVTMTLPSAYSAFDVTQSGGTLAMAGYAFTASGTYTCTGGSITDTVGTAAMTVGSFILNNASGISLPATATSTFTCTTAFTQTLGPVSLLANVTLGTTSTYTQTVGALTLNNYTLTTGIFSSTGTGVRSIAWGTTGKIVMNHSTAAQTVLNMATITNFSSTGTTNFSSDMAVSRTVVYGTTGGSSINSTNLVLTGTGSGGLTITGASWFNLLDLGTTTGGVASTTANFNSLTLSSSGSLGSFTYSGFSPTFVGTGTFTGNGVVSIFNVTINCPSGTTTLVGNVSSYNGGNAGTLTLTAGTLNLNGYVAYFRLFSSTNSNVRSLQFGSGFFEMANGNPGTVVDIATATNFTCSGTGGFRASQALTAAKTLTFGTTAGGSTANAPNVFVTAQNISITFTNGSYFNKLDFTGTWSSTATGSVNISSLTLNNTGTFTALVPTMVGTGTITSSGKTLPSLTINGSGITTTLASALTLSGALTLTLGTLNVSSYTSTIASFSSAGPTTRSITGSGTLTVTGAWTVTDGTGFTGSGYTINMTSASIKTFGGGAGAYGTLNQGGAGALTVTGSNTFENITATTRPSTITFTAGTTQTVSSFTVSGTSGNLVTLNSTSPGTIYYLRNFVGTGNSSFLNISDSNVASAFYANTNSTNSGNNTGWNFTFPAVVQSGFASFF